MQLDQSSKAAHLFRDYAAFHVTRGNQMTHVLGIPMIMISLLGLLGKVEVFALPAALGTMAQLFRLDLGVLLWALSMLWYFTVDWRMSVPFGMISLGLYFVGRTLPAPVLWLLFTVGWVFQLAGHKLYEKRSPAFLTNLRHLLIGPFWLFAKCFGFESARSPERLG